MIILTITDLIGRFHPVLVHLPIGILLLGCFFQLLSAGNRFLTLKPAIPLVYLLGGVGAVFSSITGYLLSQSGDYDASLVQLHQWMGISVAAISMVVYLLCRTQVKEVYLNVIAVFLILLTALTGHYGGSLTHGSDYITSALKSDGKGKVAIPPVPNVQQAFVYKHMVQPLLQNRCYSCHGSEKQKGKLRLDTKDFILKGGEAGTSLVAGNVEESELIKRLLLPPSNEDHMPPKEKPQLTEQEIELLKWWVSEGADFDKKAQELKQTEKIKTTLLSFQEGAKAATVKKQELPEKEVTKADASVIADLKKAGVVVIPVTGNSNYLSASFVTAKPSPEVLKLLGGLSKQLVWLNLSNTALNDDQIKSLSGLDALIRINLSRTPLTDASADGLVKLKNLQYINLVGTKITAKGLAKLAGLKELNEVYLYQSGVKKEDQAGLKKLFKKATLDFGDYSVPILAQDTTEVKPPEAGK
ncbi:c-type cytochrome domain-containing protein [Pedobacter frigoris]|uniref:c-type cytochrome domain-containing protein n=1 Tax=Pedobacter frigoris TaxID=2571272 RepID=UPI00292F7378|nr:c-type cytochrome domain-containing protein [Pedobacter frigoris]